MLNSTNDGQESRPVTVVLADDHAIVREGIAALCTAYGFQVLGQCADGHSAVEMALSLKPDFVIVDLTMPGLSGTETIRRLRAAGTPSKILVLSINRDEQLVLDALRAGADGYLLKDGPSRHLLDAVSFVRDGGVYVTPLLRGAGMFAKAERQVDADPLSVLSPRELEVFQYLVNGLRAKDIAELLDISPKTVDTYRAGLMRKLGVHDLVGLVKFAIERNLTSTSSPR
jgi:DNA-binding NarL/FixJ family response regulator